MLPEWYKENIDDNFSGYFMQMEKT